MRCTDTPWMTTGQETHALHLVQVPLPVVHALAAGEGAAARVAGAELTPFLLGPECRSLWRIRSAQLTVTPADHPWVTRMIVDRRLGATVGLAGFHGAPDARGMVEVGYRIDPAHRRRGYARAALELLLALAAADSRVAVVRATVSPDNLASLALIDQYGFREVGEQWDEEDGLETIFEVAASSLKREARR